MPIDETPYAIVTGASSGVGREVALSLLSRGWHVVGTSRQPDNIAASSRPRSVRWMQLDLSRASSVKAFCEMVRSEIPTGALVRLVNSAGFVLAGPIEAISLDEIRAQFEVNVFGHLAVVTGLLPMLRKREGRIVNIGSVSGLVSSPFFGPYAGSKFALRAFNDAMRMEFRPCGISVSMIDLGNTITPLWERSRRKSDEFTSQMKPEWWQLYGQRISAVRKATEAMQKSAIPPSKACRAVIHALTAKRPRPHYAVGADARMASLLAGLLPTRLVDYFVMRQLNIAGNNS